jgi:hypothetical protein
LEAHAVINIVLIVEEDMDAEGMRDEDSIAKWVDITLVEGRVIVPILPKGAKCCDNKM